MKIEQSIAYQWKLSLRRSVAAALLSVMHKHSIMYTYVA